jgi:chloramphenicol 3-O phosphotransferase
LTWTVTDGGGAPTCTITPGPLGDAMVRCAHAYWAACAAAGLDQVVDDVWLTREWAAGLRAALAGRPVLWVGVVCPLDVLEAREAARGDRVAGQARGQLDVVHQGSSYDVTVDTSLLTPGEAAGVVLDAAKRLPGPSSRG